MPYLQGFRNMLHAQPCTALGRQPHETRSKVPFLRGFSSFCPCKVSGRLKTLQGFGEAQTSSSPFLSSISATRSRQSSRLISSPTPSILPAAGSQ